MSRIRPIHTVLQTNPKNTGSVIFLHGSGDTGQGILEWLTFLKKNFSLPHIKFLFPSAPLRPYTPLEGALSNVWFNRLDISPDVPEHLDTINDIKPEIKTLIFEEVNSGIPLNKIIVGGFSMGGSLALHTAFRFVPGLAGVFTLSSFLNNDSVVYKEIQCKETPLLMCHGDRDTLVPIEWGKKTFNELNNLGVKGEFKTLKNTMHELKKNEIEILLEWISKIIPPDSN